jgi:hypothetical protein
MKQSMEKIQILGTELHPDDQKYVLAAYVHRFTRQHKPVWVTQLRPRPNGQPCPVQFASDADWLANTWFTVNIGGRLDLRTKYCFSTPTWPDNPELRK